MPRQTESEWMESRANRQDMRPELGWPKPYPRMGYCPKCDGRVEIGRQPFPVWRSIGLVALCFVPYFFIGLSSFLPIIGFALWRKAKATCNRCDGQDIWFKGGRDNEDLAWDALNIVLVLLWLIGLPFLLYDLAKLSQAAGVLGG